MYTVFSIELESHLLKKKKPYEKHLSTDKKNHKPKLEISIKLNRPRRHHLTVEHLLYPLFFISFLAVMCFVLFTVCLIRCSI